MTTKTDSEFLVVVDIQPGYLQACYNVLPDIIDKINNTNQKIIFFYVGRESGLDSKDDVVSFLLEHGLDEFKLDEIRFIEKDYGFFRNWMDTGVDEKLIIDTIQFMRNNKIDNTEHFTDEEWSIVLKNQANQNLKFKDGMCYPEFDNRLLKIDTVNNLELIGGSRHECLEEINLYLKSLGKQTIVSDRLCYGADSFVPKHKQNKKMR